jgi:hypothetical protein
VTRAAGAAVERRRFYVDTSAYLCMLLAEDGAERLSTETAGGELLSSVLLVLETRRNLVRLARDGALTSGQYKTCLDRVVDCRHNSNRSFRYGSIYGHDRRIFMPSSAPSLACRQLFRSSRRQTCSAICGFGQNGRGTPLYRQN